MTTKDPKIFIVEDESIVALDIEYCLKNNGYQIVGTATSYNELMGKINVAKPDLVLMDIKIQGALDGIECAKKIWEVFRTPVLYLTAYSDKNTINRATKTKAFGYLLKPFNEKTLIANIEMALSNCEEELRILRIQNNFSITLDKLNLGIIIFDNDGLITFLNLAAKSLTGWNENEVIGKPLKELFFYSKNKEEIAFERVFRERAYFNFLEVINKKDEGENSLSFDLTLSSIVQSGKIDGGILVFQNYNTLINSNLHDGKTSNKETLLEICPWCKKWRDEEKNWHEIEEFIKQKTYKEIIHRACPDCVQSLLRNIQLKFENEPYGRRN